ncbi:MAG TPA: sulfotransferase [Halioglobus sp.]
MILSPPHSFASTLCARLGRHPQLYGLPDVNLFVADTVEGWYTTLNQHMARPQSTHGLLRVLAQLHEETQSEQSVNRAWDWLSARKTWTTRSLWAYLAKLVYPRVLVDKSPLTSRSEENLQRAREMIPQAQFIHLTRHPIPTSLSVDQLRSKMQRFSAGSDEPSSLRENSLLFWLRSHKLIVNFVASLPEGQSLRVNSEQLMQDPDCYLVQLLEWLGLETSELAVAAMNHPEYSAYACLGPVNAQYGDERDFLIAPSVVPVFESPPAIDESTDFQALPERSRPEILRLSHRLGYR